MMKSVRNGTIEVEVVECDDTSLVGEAAQYPHEGFFLVGGPSPWVPQLMFVAAGTVYYVLCDTRLDAAVRPIPEVPAPVQVTPDGDSIKVSHIECIAECFASMARAVGGHG